MVKALETMVVEKIQRDELLVVGIEYRCSNIMGDVSIADFDFSEGIYIAGDTLRINISNDQEFTIEYDELENEFIIKQGETIFYLS